MFQLLTLILIFLFSHSLIAAEGQVGFDLISINQKGTVDVFRPNSKEKATSSQARLNLQLPTLKNYWTVSMSIDSAKKDYSNFLLRDEEGEEEPLSNSFDKAEYAGSLSVNYQRGKTTYSAFLAGSLSESPFSFLASSLGYNRTFLNKKRILGFRFLSNLKDQPASTYIDPKNLETKERPTELTSLRYETNWSEVITQNWRVNTIAFYGTRKEDRPDHYGLELRNGFGLQDNLTVRFHTGILNEFKTELKDDRGRFQIFWVETSVFWEFKYDLSLEASYGLVLEKETFNDSRGVADIGTDSYGLKFNYEGVDWLFSLSYILRKTNTGYKAHTFQGGLRWVI